VLVKFTANWCANSQYVEATVFHDHATLDELRHRGVLMLKADLTSRAAPGWLLLKSLNPSGGIPLTAVYLPGRDQPRRLESIYTSSTLLDVLDRDATTDSRKESIESRGRDFDPTAHAAVAAIPHSGQRSSVARRS
jgi:thiol:disulfide interchange protein